MKIKVEITRDVRLDGKHVPKGSKIEVEDNVFRSLKMNGKAKEIEQPKPVQPAAETVPVQTTITPNKRIK